VLEKQKTVQCELLTDSGQTEEGAVDIVTEKQKAVLCGTDRE
jgi:hypothetical protein